VDLRSAQAREWLCRLFTSRGTLAPAPGALDLAIDTLATLIPDDARRPVYVRVAPGESEAIYVDLADDVERTVGVPEQGGSGAISQDPLPPGTVYTASYDDDGKVGLYRIEVTLTAGTGKLRTPAGLDRGLKESLNRAWTYLQSVRERMGLGASLAQKDVVAEAIDLTGSRVECACGVAFYIAMLSAINTRRVQAATVVLGDLTIQGNIKAPPSITEMLQLALENGALRAILPIGNKSQFASLPEHVVEKVDIGFYGDVERAAAKVIEV